MISVVRWIVPPHKKAIGIINAGIAAFARDSLLSKQETLRLQVSVEGVYQYCVRNINEAFENEEIGVALYTNKKQVKIVIQHSGAGGEWDIHLKEGQDKHVRRTSFEAMGLAIALDMLESLEHTSHLDLTSGRTLRTYTLLFTSSAPVGRQLDITSTSV